MRSLPLLLCLAALAAGCNCGAPPGPGDGGPDGGAGGGAGGGDGGGSGGGSGGGGGGGDLDGGGGGSGTGGGGGGGGGGGSGGGGSGGGGGVVGPDGGCDPQVCYPFGTGAPGTGVCRSGLAYCVGGAVGPCIGAVGPSAEACNALDDDCNGTVDDAAALGQVSCGTGPCKVTVAACTAGQPTACTPNAPSAELCDGVDNDCNGAIDEVGCTCIYVSPTGLDTNPGTALAPLRTLTAAIALSASDAGLPKLVCAAAGLTCPASFDYAEAVAMKNGVSVYGGYQQTAITDGGSWPRCAQSATRITAQDAKGVLFDSAVTAPTVLDGFEVRGAGLATNAAITVEGSTGAVINDNQIFGGAGNVSIGVDVRAAARPQLTRNTILGGTGANQAIAVHSVDSAPVIQLSCALDPQGRCASAACSSTVLGDYIRGRSPGNNGAESYGVWLERSPGAVVQESAICSSQSTRTSAGVRISGDAAGTIVRTSSIDADNGAVTSVGILAEACGGAAPWLFNNFRVAGRSTAAQSRADGVRAVGDCHPRIDSNRLIVGGEESASNDAIGVFCARDADAGISSRCTVLGNLDIFGSAGGIPPSSVGVRCDDGACARISGNRISGRQGVFAAGIFLGNTGPVISRNQISAGCATTGVGLVSRNSFARIENNVIRGTQCNGISGPTPLNSFGVQVLLNTGTNEADLHSNDIFAEGAASSCTSRGLVFDVFAAIIGSGSRGLVRNNIIHAGRCPTAFSIFEFDVISNPRVLENNDLVAARDGGTLYRDDNQRNLVTAADVNALLDTTSAQNLSADPLFDGGVHLSAGSPCRNAGTSTGAPLNDLDGDARPQESAPDIGADEYVP